MADRRFNPRAMMEKAIEVMLQSREEPRTDGKASPRVGAVLVTSSELLSWKGSWSCFSGANSVKGTMPSSR